MTNKIPITEEMEAICTLLWLYAHKSTSPDTATTFCYNKEKLKQAGLIKEVGSSEWPAPRMYLTEKGIISILPYIEAIMDIYDKDPFLDELRRVVFEKKLLEK